MPGIVLASSNFHIFSCLLLTMSVPTGGAGDPADHFSGGVQDTVDPKDIMLTSKSNMRHTTIPLSTDQAELVAETAKALDTKSREQYFTLPDSGQKLFGSLEGPIVRCAISRRKKETNETAGNLAKKLQCRATNSNSDFDTGDKAAT